MTERGRYIVFEGLDGCGKTTQHERAIKRAGSKAIGIREPGGTEMAERIRTLIKDRTLKRAPRTNLYLFAAARAELIDTIIRPAIAAGKHGFSDRNWLSTLAYQAGGEGVNRQEIIDISQLATQEFFEPDLTIFIDVDVATCRERMAQSSAHGGLDYFDTKGPDFFERVRQEYLDQIATMPNAIVIDGSGTADEVEALAWKPVAKLLNL